MQHVVHVHDPPQPRYYEEKWALKDRILSGELVWGHVVLLEHVLVESYVPIPGHRAQDELGREAEELLRHLVRGDLALVDDVGLFGVAGGRQLHVAPPRGVVFQEDERAYHEGEAAQGVAHAVYVISGRADLGSLPFDVLSDSGDVAVEVVQKRSHFEQHHPQTAVGQTVAGNALGAQDRDEHVEDTYRIWRDVLDARYIENVVDYCDEGGEQVVVGVV